jgi:hypothetical protein
VYLGWLVPHEGVIDVLICTVAVFRLKWCRDGKKEA